METASTAVSTARCKRLIYGVISCSVSSIASGSGGLCMTGVRRRFVATAVAAVALSALVRTQSPRPLGIVDMLNIPRLADPQLSPDGRDVLFTRGDADWKAGRRISPIRRAPAVDAGGGTPVQLTSGAEGETSPRWSPDGKTIAFTAKRGDNEFAQIYLLPVEGGEARQLTGHASAVSDPTGARERAKDDVYSYDENYKQKHLWKVSVATKTETPVTKGDFTVNSYELSEDGRKIVYHRWPTPLLGDNERGEVWVANADGAAAVQLTHNAVPENDATISPDDSQVLFVSGTALCVSC